jgi:hypothetical protein
VLRGQSARALAATVEVSAFLQGSKDEVAPEAGAAPEPEGAADATGEAGSMAPEAAAGAAGAAPVAPSVMTPSRGEGAVL